MAERDGDKTTPGYRPANGVSLGAIVEQLGPGILQVLVAPEGLDVEVRHITLHDPAEPLRIEAGDMVLGLGIDVSQGQGTELLESMAVHGGATVAVKRRGTPLDGLVAAAERLSIALVEVSAELAWEQLYSLLRTVLASAGQSPDPARQAAPLGDLFALANAVGAMVGGPTTIEDPHSRVLAYSTLDQPIDVPRRQTILGRRVPEDWVRRHKEDGVFKELWSSGDVVRLPARKEDDGTVVSERLAIAVRAGDEILGSIWVAHGDDSLGPEAEDALREAADIAALHLVRHQAGEDIERRLRSDLLRRLLEGRGSVNAISDRLGLDLAGDYIVVAFEIQASEEIELSLQQERALQLVSVYCEAYRRHATLATVGRTIYALIPTSDASSMDGIDRLVDYVLTQSHKVLATSLLIGVGSPVGHLRDVPRSREDADEVLRVLTNNEDHGQAATFETVRTQIQLLKLKDLAEQEPRLHAGKVAVLVEEDAASGSEYVETLRAYLNAFGHVPTAAEAIGVHPNTFRYRLRRLGEIAELDLEDADERLVVELQLRLLEHYRAG